MSYEENSCLNVELVEIRLRRLSVFVRKKGYPVTQRINLSGLKSDEVASLIDELVRVQLRDIALLRGFALEDPKNPNLKALAAAIGARGFMVSCLKPKLEPGECGSECR